MFFRSVLIRAESAVHRQLWLMRAVTLGVRAIVLDDHCRVLLVRHTYLPGWYLPGGSVDRGETAEAAIIREVFEEGGIRCSDRPALHGFYRNGHHDHVACYIIRHFNVEAPARGNSWEIAETAFFALDALPDGTTPATRTRLAEFCDGQTIAADW